MKRLIIGILAHVDAGKTTLAESLLYQTGSIRKFGRVDHKDAFLDTYELERARGITIFSKQAEFTHEDMMVTLLDTPGHVDFSAEMERTLQVLDYAILVISGSDGIQGHSETLWKLLLKYKIPTFLFINKMDLEGTNSKELLVELKNRFHEGMVNFNDEYEENTQWLENLAICDERLLDEYMDTNHIERIRITQLVRERKIFPCYFGSALRQIGVIEFLQGLLNYTCMKEYPDNFGAKIYKIARDDQGNRLTYMKITGGSLKVKMLLTNKKVNAINNRVKDNVDVLGNSQKALLKNIEEIWEEKVDQIRIYSGSKYETVDEVHKGMICVVTGLSKTYPGEGLGMEAISDMPILEPVLNYQILLPSECDPQVMLTKLRILEEEDPLLRIVWSEQLKEIHVQLMGEVQIEILKNVILDRFGVEVEFGTGNIVYKETIINEVVGIGHFEPLRHYAEVHLLLEPAERGSGLSFFSTCSEDVLDRSWQRLVLTHLEEKEHIGVLTGSTITDMKITLLTGRAHLKHTEGGDFRQATYRALRQGLKKAKSILLEPYYSFRLEVPHDMIGRAMSDISRMHGHFNPPEIDGEMSILIGYGPVIRMRGYQTEVTSYTKGRGKLFTSLKGYEPCHNEDEVVQEFNYDSERDLDNPTSSVFCSHGAGFVVEWDRVDDYKHLDSGFKPREDIHREKNLELNSTEKRDRNNFYIDGKSKESKPKDMKGQADIRRNSYKGTLKEDKELEDIFVRTFGPIKQKHIPSQGGLGYEKKIKSKEIIDKNNIDKHLDVITKDYLLVDGYNIIFAWKELNELAKENIDAARYKLMDILCNYQGFKNCQLIVVFDAYKVKGGIGSVSEYHNIHVVYTKEAETADAYIEKFTQEISKKQKYKVTVATSDAMEQLIIMGQGAMRLSANDLKEEIKRVGELIRKEYLEKTPNNRNYIGKQFADTLLEFIKMDEDSFK